MKNRNLQTKRMIRTFLFVLLFGMAGLTKSYAYDFSAVCETGQTLYYNITNAEYHYVELTFPGNYDWNGYNRPIGDVILPRYVYDADDNQYLVITIGNNAFSSCYQLTSITIPNSVTTIGSSAFSGCERLTSITIPNSVTSIGDQAFYRCYGLTSLTIGNSVTTIGWLAFSKCSGLTSITIPNSVTTIGEGAFSLCTGLTSITIPNSVTSIGQSPFFGCSGIEEILVESGNIVYDSRDNSNAIIRTSANELVQGCKNTVIPNSVISINTDAFSYCTGLTSIDIPNSVISIRDYAFRSCTSLTSIEIPSSVAWMSGLTFSGCSGIEEILVESGNTVYDSRGNCNAIIRTSDNALIRGCKNTVIPNSVTSIGNHAFSGCGLTSIEIPDFITWLGNGAFQECSSLTSVTIGNSVTEINSFTFNGCSSLASITIGNSVTSIGTAAFQGCGAIRYIYALPEVPPFINNDSYFGLISSSIPVYVPCSAVENYQTTSGWSRFTNIIGLCSGEVEVIADPLEGGTVTGAGYYSGGDVCVLTATPNSGYVFTIWTENGIVVSMDTVFSFYAHPTTIMARFVPVGNIVFADANVKYRCVTNWDTNGDGELSYVEAAAVTDLGNVFYSASTITSFDELQYFRGLSSICNDAFNYCFNLASIVMPSSVTTIGSRAFNYCNLTSIEIPSSVTTIGSSAFNYCCNLTSIEIPSSVTTIGSSAFNYCYNLTSIEIPSSVTTIGNYAFSGCSGFTGELIIPNSVTLIGNGAFAGCSGFEQILVESGNTIYDSRGNCNAIIHTSTNELIIGCKNTIIPNSVTSIGSYAFQGCSGLTSITIPNSVTSIGQKAFYGCNGLSSSIMMSITPPTLEFSDAFSTTNNTLRIYVPYESLEVYKTAPNWSSYQAIIFPWVKKSISGYGTGNGGWYFIASPLLSSVAPTEINGMIQEQDYDLYRFNQSGEAEWENYKNPIHTQEFTINNGKGYLYASKEDVDLLFIGVANEFDERMVSLVYDVNASFAGWNLVGNPFQVDAYANKSYYVMNEDGTAIEPVAVSMETAIPPCTGIMVRAEMTGQSVIFTKESRQVPNNNGTLQIAVAQTNTRSTSTGSVTALDKVVVSFNEGDELGKFDFNKDNAKLYIPQGNEDYAIAYAEKQGEMPLNFETNVNGNYTITINPENVEMDYLHLIDNMTGKDVDLLATPSYTFESKTSDYVSRFRLVFSASGDTNNEDEESFAFVSNGNIIVTGEYANATLQIVDMLGHVVVNTDVAHNVSTNGIASGVYVLRIINGDDVKTQKIVIR